MAQIIDAKYSTLIGTAAELRRLLQLMGQTAIVDLKFSNLVVLDKSPNTKQLAQALESTPRTQEKT